MEEATLLKERLHAITEKRRIQEDIRQRKLELDQEKLSLQHLKKKALREQWLLQDSASHNAAGSDQQKTRALQRNINRIEMEVDSLEGQESMISAKESLILNRLKAVEKSPGDIIKEAQDNFFPEPFHVPESLSSTANQIPETNTPRKTLFAMEINVSKNLLTGTSTVLSTATVPPEELEQYSGRKVYDDGRKCVYALNTQESCESELSANEVEHLLRSATVHRQANQLNPSRREEHCFCHHQDERDTGGRVDLRKQRAYLANRLLGNNIAEKDLSCWETWQRKPGPEHCCAQLESQNRRHQERNNQSINLGNHKRAGQHYGNQIDGHSNSYPVRNGNIVASHHTRSSSSIPSNSVANGGPPPRSHDQEAVSAYQPQLCYTPANHIPYISVDKEEVYCYHSDDAMCSGRVPSPLYADDTPYTILNAMETTEPITAIFMGFQTAQDDSRPVKECEDSLKAELVIIEDDEDSEDDLSMKEKKCYVQPGEKSYSTGSSANGNVGRMEGVGDRWTEKRVGPGIRKIQKKHKACCTVC
ncbi:palmdelphin-like [Etheostoma cragini]|uniref:palmdelphin-like n=1 Tax=Etheostoma cragini TaxID=417921 RepID=UPI00155E76E2|nr:palmdelphin-like [Etheostoma cragini]XP_034743595.1 palmdelphin-like [Etheostoma cragini]